MSGHGWAINDLKPVFKANVKAKPLGIYKNLSGPQKCPKMASQTKKNIISQLCIFFILEYICGHLKILLVLSLL